MWYLVFYTVIMTLSQQVDNVNETEAWRIFGSNTSVLPSKQLLIMRRIKHQTKMSHDLTFITLYKEAINELSI